VERLDGKPYTPFVWLWWLCGSNRDICACDQHAWWGFGGHVVAVFACGDCEIERDLIAWRANNICVPYMDNNPHCIPHTDLDDFNSLVTLGDDCRGDSGRIRLALKRYRAIFMRGLAVICAGTVG
jgi:hypothetical protein